MSDTNKQLQTSGEQRSHITSLDGIRALCCLGVIGHHFGIPGCKAGWIGVEMFFSLSGFLITTLLHREYVECGRINLPYFWIRRALRLLPIYWLYIAIVTAFVLVSHPSDWTQINHWTPGWYLASLWLYFANLAPHDMWIHQNATIHLWSLAKEEQFYLLWPILLVFTIQLPRSWIVPTLLAAVSIFAVMPGVPESFANYARYVPIGLMVGCSVALFMRLEARSIIAQWIKAPAIRNVAAIICALMLAVLAIRTERFGDPATRPWANRVFVPLYAFPFTILIAGMWYGTATRVDRWLSVRPLAYLGMISYGLYLYHMPLVNMTKGGFVLLEAHTGIHVRFVFTAIVFLALTLAISSLSYSFIERPLLRIGKRFRPHPVTPGEAEIATAELPPVAMATKVSGQRFHQLDGLRALAATLVVVHHLCTASLATTLAAKGHAFLANAIATTTASGVELFFVLSGVLLLRPYVRSGRPMQPGRYLYARVRRLWPPYLMAWLLAGASVFLVARFPTWWTRGASLPQFSWFDWISQLGIVYTGNHAFSFAWWSLSVEALFYLIVPLFVGLIFLLKPSRSAMVAVFALTVAAAVLMTSQFDGVLGQHWWPVQRFITYASCFAAGVAMAQFDFGDRWGWSAILIGIPYCMIAFAHPKLNVHVGWGLVYFGLVAVALNGKSTLSHWLARRPLVWLGERSYSLFLVHYAVITAVCQIVSLLTMQKGWQYFVITRAIEIPVILLVTMFVFHFVERRFAKNLVTADRFWPITFAWPRREIFVEPSPVLVEAAA
ncbi:MAG: acyltransferase [Phycisphaerae bacterium]|nr:acyltransferase [Phycisphaerae bacterium]